MNSHTITTHLESLGLGKTQKFHYCLSPAELTEFATRNNEGIFSIDGALVVNTGQHTGRSPNDKYLVKSEGLEDIWWGKINQPLTPEGYRYLKKNIIGNLKKMSCLFKMSISVRIVRIAWGFGLSVLKPGTDCFVIIYSFPFLKANWPALFPR